MNDPGAPADPPRSTRQFIDALARGSFRAWGRVVVALFLIVNAVALARIILW